MANFRRKLPPNEDESCDGKATLPFPRPIIPLAPLARVLVTLQLCAQAKIKSEIETGRPALEPSVDCREIVSSVISEKPVVPKTLFSVPTEQELLLQPGPRGLGHMLLQVALAIEHDAEPQKAGL